MIEFEAIDWFDIKDRGRAATVAWGRTAGEARALLGQSVSIDGTTYMVTGVETHAMADPFIEKVIGLLVRAEHVCDWEYDEASDLLRCTHEGCPLVIPVDDDARFMDPGETT